MSDERTRDAVARVRAGFERAKTELSDLVRIPSVSSDRAHTGDVVASAEATAAMLERYAVPSVRIVTVGDAHPYVIGEWLERPGAPTVLLYAHHDVMPPGIVANWTSDPFEPVERDGRLYGRGTADDKAGAIAHAAAVKAWLDSSGSVPCNVRIVVEGEEEIGSPHLGEFLAKYASELTSDVLVLADAGNWKVGVPGLTYSLRGLTDAVVRVRALNGPVHSGMAGGIVPDPAMALAGMLGSLTDEHGEIAVAGFDDDVMSPSAQEVARYEALPPDGDGLRDAFGVRPGVVLSGDPQRSIYERLWRRPSLTIVGFDSHPIAGSSNQIVARASARLSVRLAPGQSHKRALDLLDAHLRASVPFHLEYEFERGAGGPAWTCDPTGEVFTLAIDALRAGFGTEPVLMGEGGSIPFVGPFADAFGGIPALLFGPADPSSAIHGEDESLHLDDFRKLIESEVHLLALVGEHLTAVAR